jgi:CheY-like chemotaxis protein
MRSLAMPALRPRRNRVNVADPQVEQALRASRDIAEPIGRFLRRPGNSASDGGGGYEAARRIREQPGQKGLTLVALTGWGHAENRSRTEAAGFDVHTVKPVDLSALQGYWPRRSSANRTLKLSLAVISLLSDSGWSLGPSSTDRARDAHAARTLT